MLVRFLVRAGNAVLPTVSVVLVRSYGGPALVPLVRAGRLPLVRPGDAGRYAAPLVPPRARALPSCGSAVLATVAALAWLVVLALSLVPLAALGSLMRRIALTATLRV